MIADYLNAARGVSCSAEQVIVVPGAQVAFDIIAQLLLDPGDTALIEDPGYFGARESSGGREFASHQFRLTGMASA